MSKRQDGPVNYGEAQAEEVEVLRAIYMEDFEESQVKSAWSKADLAFKLTLKSFSDETTSVVLSVQLTATYPRTPPLLTLHGLDDLHSRTQARIQYIVQKRPSQMLGEVMMHTIASEIQDALEDAVQAREQGVLPSLQDERATQEAAAHVQAREDETVQARREQEAQAEEDRVLQQMVEEEVGRREAKKRGRPSPKATTSNSNGEDLGADVIRFDQVVRIPYQADLISCEAVETITCLSASARSQIYSAKPISLDDQSGAVVAVRCAQLDAPVDDTSTKSGMLVLEQELEVLKTLRQSNIANVHAFKIDPVKSDSQSPLTSWQVTILSDYANRGSLDELLEDGQTLQLERCRQWSLDLLEALDFYHRHGVVHKSIQCRNILITRTSAGVTVPLLAGAAYQQRIHMLQDVASVKGVKKHTAGWPAPECAMETVVYTRKTDIWDYGRVLVEMLFGFGITDRYHSSSNFLDSTDLSDPLDSLLQRLFNREQRLRPSAFEVLPSEFLRSNAPILAFRAVPHGRAPSSSTALATSGHKSPSARRSRHNSSNVAEPALISRYANDFTEVHRLGKGGFGEVVKARNKVDGGIYAIKKIKQDSTSQLEQVLSEVMLLHRLNHAYVVRYYSAWVEDDVSGLLDMDESAVSTSEDFTNTSTDSPGMDFGLSSRGLDFVSSSGYHNIEFGDDDDDDDDEHEQDEIGTSESDSDEDESRVPNKLTAIQKTSTDEAVDDSDLTEPSQLKKPRAASRRAVFSTLYIQMEYCERHTLRDLIRKGMYAKIDEGWQMLRQILEGLAHIHGHGIIHRDLKPDNVFIDAAGNPRIGDFGLATTSRYNIADNIIKSSNTGAEMTRSVGTALYVAPELRSSSGSSYSDKVDMYSLGIIFFEMTCSLPTAMERHQVLSELRQKEHQLPPTYQAPERSLQGNVITSLISHTPSERPSSVELLRGGQLPLQIEDETIRQALQSLSDSGSPYYQKMMSALFSQTQDQRIKNYAWDANDSKARNVSENELRLRSIARHTLASIFHRHGAEETQRSILVPRSGYYNSPNVVQLLDATGSLLQLPYDLTLPHARQLARNPSAVQRTFVFGQVYRDVGTGGPPRTNGEVDFDIVSMDHQDSELYEAEAIKVVDEILDEVPALASAPMCFHINHSDLLDTVLDFCRIDKSQRLAVKESLSNLNIHKWTWQNVRAELRSPLLAIPASSLDELAQFDFRDTPDKAFQKLQSIFADSSHINRIKRPIQHLRQLVETLHLFGLHRKIYICPLASYNEKFYAGGVIFQSVHDKKSRSVFAAGGRYDHLIASHRTRGQTTPLCHAVGVNIGWDGLIASMLRYQKDATNGAYLKKKHDESQSSLWDAKRCDVLIASVDPTVLRSTGVTILASLWSQDISAELAIDTRSLDEVLGRQKDSSHSWVVTVKHEASTTVRVRNISTDTESEVPTTNLISHLRLEMRERDQRYLKTMRAPSLLRHTSHSETERKSNVQVLMAQHRSKKSNKYHIVEAAQQRWAEKVDEWKDAPILAIETRDDVLESLREARLSDAESWRKAIQSVQLSERLYLGQIQELLREMRKKWMEGDGTREACVFNFRTGSCIYYDLGL